MKKLIVIILLVVLIALCFIFLSDLVDKHFININSDSTLVLSDTILSEIAGLLMKITAIVIYVVVLLIFI